jgi:hypothetical protein
MANRLRERERVGWQLLLEVYQKFPPLTLGSLSRHSASGCRINLSASKGSPPEDEELAELVLHSDGACEPNDSLPQESPKAEEVPINWASCSPSSEPLTLAHSEAPQDAFRRASGSLRPWLHCTACSVMTVRNTSVRFRCISLLKLTDKYASNPRK